MNDYSTLLAFMHPRTDEGDVIEIGVLAGKGTRQLAEAFPGKTIVAVDIFDIYADSTPNTAGTPMSQFYEDELQGRDQIAVFNENTKGLENILVHKGDSIKYKPKRKVWLTIIDGGHSASVLKKDIKNSLKSRYIAFHDYKHDIPEVTRTIDELTEGWARYEIGSTFLVCEPPTS